MDEEDRRWKKVQAKPVYNRLCEALRSYNEQMDSDYSLSYKGVQFEAGKMYVPVHGVSAIPSYKTIIEYFGHDWPGADIREISSSKWETQKMLIVRDPTVAGPAHGGPPPFGGGRASAATPSPQVGWDADYDDDDDDGGGGGGGCWCFGSFGCVELSIFVGLSAIAYYIVVVKMLAVKPADIESMLRPVAEFMYRRSAQFSASSGFGSSGTAAPLPPAGAGSEYVDDLNKIYE